MIRLFIAEKLEQGQGIDLSEGQRHYLLNVMRCRIGDEVLLFNGKDGEWQSIIHTLDKKRSEIIPQKQTRKQEKEKKCILCPAIIKKENFDWVLQKATELGATEIRPLITERTVVGKLNLERAKAILTEAAEQCERLNVPDLKDPQKLESVLTNLPENIKAVCLAERDETTAGLKPEETYAFFIGPEGGWTPKEIALFKQKGVMFRHLGKTILRAETASVAVLSIWQYALSGE